MPAVRKTLKERFEEKFHVTPGCWIWTAAKNAQGYGQIKVGGVLERANRIAYQLYVGPIPDSLHVLHRCDRPECVNPEHLWSGTAKDNHRDRVEKGRSRPIYGEKNPCSRLTNHEVAEIRDLLTCKLFTQRAIAGFYATSQTTVDKINSGKARSKG